MKRTIVALFCLVCIFSFTSCATVDVKISFSKSVDEVEPLLNEITSLDFTEERIYFPAPVDWIHLYQDCVVSVVYTDDSQ